MPKQRFFGVASKMVGTTGMRQQAEYVSDVKIDALTVLPTACNGRLAVLYMLAFLPFREGLDVTFKRPVGGLPDLASMSSVPWKLASFFPYDREVSLDSKFAITEKTLNTCNNLRQAIGAASGWARRSVGNPRRGRCWAY